MGGKLSSHRGQFFSADVMLAVVLFLGILVSFFATHSYLNRTIDNQETKNDMMQIASSLSSLLVETGGYPNNWQKFKTKDLTKDTGAKDKKYVFAIGLSKNADGWNLDQAKIDKFTQLNSSYTFLKDTLGVKGAGYEFYIKITRILNFNINNVGSSFICSSSTVNNNVVDSGDVLIQNCTINGNIDVDNGRLKLIESNVNGNVLLDNVDLEMKDNNVGGNLNIDDSGILLIEGNTIDGDVDVRDSKSLYLVGNIIDGDLDIKCSVGVIEISSNDVEGDIDLCHNSDDGVYEIGIYPPDNAENVINVERYVLLNGERAKLNIMVWQNE